MREVMSSILIISTLKALARPRTKLCFVRVSLFTAAAGCLGGLVGHDVCFTRRRSRVRVSPRVFFLPIYETACPRYLGTIPRGPTGPRLLALREQPARPPGRVDGVSRARKPFAVGPRGPRLARRRRGLGPGRGVGNAQSRVRGGWKLLVALLENPRGSLPSGL